MSPRKRVKLFFGGLVTVLPILGFILDNGNKLMSGIDRLVARWASASGSHPSGLWWGIGYIWLTFMITLIVVWVEEDVAEWRATGGLCALGYLFFCLSVARLCHLSLIACVEVGGGVILALLAGGLVGWVVAEGT